MEEKIKLRGYQFLKFNSLGFKTVWIFRVTEISNKIFPWIWLNQLTYLLLLIVNSLLPILSEVSTLPANTASNLIHRFSGQLDFLCSVNAIPNLLQCPPTLDIPLDPLHSQQMILHSNADSKQERHSIMKIPLTSLTISINFLVPIFSYLPVPKKLFS